MKTLKENTIVFPKMKADQSGIVKGRYSNAGTYEPSLTDLNSDLLSAAESSAGSSSSSGSSSSGSSSSGSNALGWFNSAAGFVSGIFTDINDAISNKNQGKWGTDAYNNAQAAMYNSQKSSGTKNTGLIIAVVAIAVVMVVGFGILIAKKK